MAVLSGGAIRQVGSIDEVFSRPVDVDVAAAVGVEAVLPGQVVADEDGLVTVRVGDADIRAVRGDGASGSVFVCIRAEDVMLETSARDGASARNRWTGDIVSVQHEGAVVRVGVNCGFALTALLTRPAYDELQLAPGKPVTAVVKATAVHLIAR